MGIINIHEAVREGSRTVISLVGASGSGKTHTAILLADGLANGDAKKIGFLDAENKRGSLYSDVLKDENGNSRRFLIGDLLPPFSPERYAQAIKEFEAAGVEVLIIDSVTHEWEGTGGCSEVADNYINGNPKKTAIGWAKAKMSHKKFINTLLQCDMHVICCVRGREQTSFKNPSKPVSLGIQPIQEKNFMFEMTVSLLMHDEGRSQTTLKCPTELRHIFGRNNDYITAKDGLALRDWVSGGSKIDRKVEQYKNKLIGVAENGLSYTRECWNKTPEDIRDLLGKDFKTQLYGSAEGYDTIKKRSEPEKPKENLGDKLKSIAPKEKSNPLYETKEWQRWANMRDKFNDLVEGWPEPTTIEECIQAKQQLNQAIDQQTA